MPGKDELRSKKYTLCAVITTFLAIRQLQSNNAHPILLPIPYTDKKIMKKHFKKIAARDWLYNLHKLLKGSTEKKEVSSCALILLCA